MSSLFKKIVYFDTQNTPLRRSPGVRSAPGQSSPVGEAGVMLSTAAHTAAFHFSRFLMDQHPRHNCRSQQSNVSHTSFTPLSVRPRQVCFLFHRRFTRVSVSQRAVGGRDETRPEIKASTNTTGGQSQSFRQVRSGMLKPS